MLSVICLKLLYLNGITPVLVQMLNHNWYCSSVRTCGNLVHSTDFGRQSLSVVVKTESRLNL